MNSVVLCALAKLLYQAHIDGHTLHFEEYGACPGWTWVRLKDTHGTVRVSLGDATAQALGREHKSNAVWGSRAEVMRGLERAYCELCTYT